MGMSANYLSFASASGKINNTKKMSQSSVVVVLKQIFFTLSVDSSSLPPYGTLLALRHDTSDIDKKLSDEIKSRKSEIVYVSDVSYGRLIFLLVRSNESQKDLEVAAKAGGSYFGIGANADLTSEKKKIWEDADIQCAIVGSSSKGDAVGQIFNSGANDIVSKINNYMGQSTRITNPSEAVPLVFSVKYARDNATALIADHGNFDDWRPWKKLYAGQTSQKLHRFEIPPPAKLTGDGEMDSGDSSAEIKIGYDVRVNESKTGLIVDCEMTATEWQKKFKKKKDTQIHLQKRFRINDLVQNGFKIETLNEGAQKIDRFSGKHLDPVKFPNFADAEDIWVKYDKKGRSDQDAAKLVMDIMLKYRVLPHEIPN